jgi:hypothetical protein
LIDPHSDLASAALGLVPGARHNDVVYLDVARTDRPFGLNLLDVGLGWPRDRIVSNALRVFQMEFDHYWGPRMELVFRFALLLLVEANQQMVAADPTGGRDRQWTILEVPRVLEDATFRRALLADVRDRQVLDWWRTFYDMLDRRFQLEIINPVQTKTYKPAANLTARAIVGQSRSTVDPWAWVRDGALVVVDVAKEQVGADIAALLGGTLANLVALAIGRQAALSPSRRRHVALLVDEFHALPAADYAALLAELAKYGASLTLATQTLGALVGPSGERHLLDAVFGNTDHLFAFNCAATDAKVLAPELGAPVEPADLVELGDFQCYARLSHRGERLPSFSLRLDPHRPATRWCRTCWLQAPRHVMDEPQQRWRRIARRCWSALRSSAGRQRRRRRAARQLTIPTRVPCRPDARIEPVGADEARTGHRKHRRMPTLVAPVRSSSCSRDARHRWRSNTSLTSCRDPRALRSR